MDSDLNKKFIHAVFSGNYQKTIELLSAGACVKSATKDGSTALHIAAVKGYQTVSEILITNGADLNAQDFRGDTPLMLAIQGNHVHIGNLLIKQNADLSLVNSNGFSALHEAVVSGDQFIVATLLDNYSGNIDERTEMDRTALHLLCLSSNPNVDILKSLIKFDANPLLLDNYGRTPLKIAKEKMANNLIVQLKAYTDDWVLRKTIEPMPCSTSLEF